MRKAKREIRDEAELAELIRCTEYGVLSMVDGDAPYAVPVNLAWDGRYFYIHCATEGKKLDILRANPQAHISLTPEARLVAGDARHPCACTMRYRSVLVAGRAEILPPGGDERARRKAYLCLVARSRPDGLPPDEPNAPGGPEPDGLNTEEEAALARVTFLRILPERISGKRNPAK
jgi:nitroimidazol reductase NimA-like FMN-containing flavoprotein (pyridoxamine 5'-phosphate oxidase superfamily)